MKAVLTISRPPWTLPPLSSRRPSSHRHSNFIDSATFSWCVFHSVIFVWGNFSTTTTTTTQHRQPNLLSSHLSVVSSLSPVAPWWQYWTTDLILMSSLQRIKMETAMEMMMMLLKIYLVTALKAWFYLNVLSYHPSIQYKNRLPLLDAMIGDFSNGDKSHRKHWFCWLTQMYILLWQERFL